ncbi:MAG: hypothetical protein EBU49_09395 [Proteobacteria bacterium]|nr:hypothetical protein [Pseudomonadota bacterium]
MKKTPIAVHWFRRDLRLHDNTALAHATQSEWPVLPIFIFDQNILQRLEDRADGRVTFIHDTLMAMHQTGVLAHVLPGFPNKIALHNVITSLLELYDVSATWRWQARLAFILYFSTVETAERMRLKLSNRDRRAVLWGRDGFDAISAAGTEVADLLSFVTRCDREAGHGSLHDWLHPVWTQLAGHFNEAARDERLRKINATLNAEKNFGARRTTPMPVTGKDIMEQLELYQGKRVGEILAALERAWLNGSWTTRDEGLALAVSKLKSMPLA